MTYSILLKNALLDEQLTPFTQEKFSDYIKRYPGTIYTVGIDVPKGSSDEVCAKFCLENDCEFLTPDKGAYDEIFSVKQIKLIEIIQILENEPTIPRPVYSLRFRTALSP